MCLYVYLYNTNAVASATPDISARSNVLGRANVKGTWIRRIRIRMFVPACNAAQLYLCFGRANAKRALNIYYMSNRIRM